MENLNDLIWSDEEDSDNIQPQNERMHEICMIAFCGVVRGGGSGGGDTAGNVYACIQDGAKRSGTCG